MKWIIRPVGWREFLIPPSDWLWAPHKPFAENNPFAHIVGGILIGTIVSILWPEGAAWRHVLLTGAIGAYREEGQVELWSERGGYPACFAYWDTLSYLVGAMLVELAWRIS